MKLREDVSREIMEVLLDVPYPFKILVMQNIGAHREGYAGWYPLNAERLEVLGAAHGHLKVRTLHEPLVGAYVVETNHWPPFVRD